LVKRLDKFSVFGTIYFIVLVFCSLKIIHFSSKFDGGVRAALPAPVKIGTPDSGLH